METTRKDYQAKMEAQLKEWEGRLQTLEAKAEKAGADAKKELLAQLAELKKHQATGKQHLASVQAAASSTWDGVKADLSDKWNHLSGAVDAIWARTK